MMREYDEHGYLVHYIFRWHGELVRPEDRLPPEGYLRDQVPEASKADIEALLSDGDIVAPDIKTERALLSAWDDFNAALCERLIEEHGLRIRRCPECGRILESPGARQCLWCGRDWHGEQAG